MTQQVRRFILFFFLFGTRLTKSDFFNVLIEVSPNFFLNSLFLLGFAGSLGAPFPPHYYAPQSSRVFGIFPASVISSFFFSDFSLSGM